MYLINEPLSYATVCDEFGEDFAKLPISPLPAVGHLLLLPEFEDDMLGRVYKVTEITHDYIDGVIRVWTTLESK